MAIIKDLLATGDVKASGKVEGGGGLYDENGNNVSTTYLPLSGGTITGPIINDVSTGIAMRGSSKVAIAGGETWANCAGLELHDGISSVGKFLLRACDSSTGKTLEGSPDGTLLWDGKTVDYVESSGTNYIRYSNGLQICFGYAGMGTWGCWSFPRLFSANPIATVTAYNRDAPYIPVLSYVSTSYIQVTMSYLNSDGTCVTYTDNAPAVHVIAIGWWK